jgi:N-acetylglucosaminyl-diphospho-decaprenol L-rhamnosyltransferase
MNRTTISIVSHGHGVLLRNLLLDLAGQSVAASFDVIVTLNLADEVVEPSDFFGLRLKILRNPQPKGFGANHNAAFAHCCTQWFLIVNPDIQLPESGAVERLVRSGHAAGGLTAPRVTNSAGVPEDSIRRNLTPWSLVRRAAGLDREPLSARTTRLGEPFFWLAGMFLFVDSDAFRAVGGFDERFFLYCEDYDLCVRLYNEGFPLTIIDHIHVVHDAQRDSHRSSRHLKWHLSSLMKVWTSRAFWRLLTGASA